MEDRERFLAALLAGALLLAGFGVAGSADLDTSEHEALETDPSTSTERRASEDNGFVMMIHGQMDPSIGYDGPPPAYEALVTANQDGRVYFFAIPYSVDEASPVIVSGPELRIEAPATGGAHLLTPTGDPSDHEVCEAETSISGYEGPIETCLPFSLPAEELEGENAVLLTLRFGYEDDRYVEIYNAASHAMLHSSMEGGPVSMEDADAAGAQHTPFIVQDRVDPM